MNKYCDLCQQGPITGESQWQQHIGGKKHKKNLWKQGSGMQYDLPDDKRSSYFVASTENVETIEVTLQHDDDLEELVKYEPSYPSQKPQQYHGPQGMDFPALGSNVTTANNGPPDSYPPLPSSVNQLSSRLGAIGLGRGVGRGTPTAPGKSWSNITKASALASTTPMQPPIPQPSKPSEPRQLTQSERSGNVKVIQQPSAVTPVSTGSNRPMAKAAKLSMAKRIYHEYKARKKTASQAIQEITANRQWTLEEEEVTPGSGSLYNYAMRWIVNGFTCEAGEGRKKKEAKENASKKALSRFSNVIEYPEKHSVEDIEEEPASAKAAGSAPTGIRNPSDDYKQLSIRKIESLIKTVTKIELGHPVKFAAFIITKQLNQPACEGEVVALAAGRDTTKFSMNEMEEAYGYRLRDMQAAVLAKRAFQAYLYGQISQTFQTDIGKYGDSILEYNQNAEGRFRLKPGVRIHLYLSHAPSGDAISYLRDEWIEPDVLSENELDRDLNGRLEEFAVDPQKGYGRLRVVTDPMRDETRFVGDQCNGMSNKVPIMSLSDKIMKWNHLGVQGALLTHFLEPIFLYSIQMGCKYRHEHVARALLTRVPISIFPSLPGGYSSASDPFIGRTTKMTRLHNRPEGGVAWDWFLGTPAVEVIDCNEGLVDMRNPVHDAECSRLSSVTMLLRLKTRWQSVFASGNVDSTALTRRLRRTVKGEFEKSSYGELKALAKDYQKAKNQLYSSLSSTQMGSWKPKKSLQGFALSDYLD